MSICLHLILSAHEKVPDSRIIAYDDSYKPIEDVWFPIMCSVTTPNLFLTYRPIFQIPFPAFTLVPEYTLPLEYANRNFLRKASDPLLNAKDKLNNETTRIPWSRYKKE